MKQNYRRCPNCGGPVFINSLKFYFYCQTCRSKKISHHSFPEGYLKGFWSGYDKGKSGVIFIEEDEDDE